MAGTLTFPKMDMPGLVALAGFVPAMSKREWLSGSVLVGLSALVLAWPTAAPEALTTFVRVLPPAQVAALLARNLPTPTGVVERIREMASEGGSELRRFEMTVRMRDGTMRVSNETGLANWRAGDQVSFIGAPAVRP
jgi:hypothetical protein